MEYKVSQDVVEAYRTQAKEDLTLFLKLRADELVDNCFGLYLMVADFKRGQDDSNPLRHSPESLFSEAFEAAAKKFQKEGRLDMFTLTREALISVKFSQFYRCEADIQETLSQDCFKNVLDLMEVHLEEVLVDCKDGIGIVNFWWSIHGNALLAGLRSWARGREENSKLDLAVAIADAVKEQATLLAEKYYPDGKNYFNFMYFVVRRQPRLVTDRIGDLLAIRPIGRN